MRFEDFIGPACFLVLVGIVIVAAWHALSRQKFEQWRSGFDRSAHESTHPTDFARARRLHESRLEQIIQRLAGSQQLRTERVADGKWRAWLGGSIFELASLRASWTTKPGALRMLLREQRMQANGGVFVTLAMENNPAAVVQAADDHDHPADPVVAVPPTSA